MILSAMRRLDKIIFLFPGATEAEKEWCAYFYALLEQIPSFRTEEALCPSFADTALPVIEFRTGDLKLPMILMNTDEEIRLHHQQHPLLVSTTSGDIEGSPMTGETVITLHDDVHHQQTAGNTISYLLYQLQGRLTGVDHTGLNIPASALDHSEWDAAMAKIGSVSNLYRYPEEEWPFIIPASDAEFEADITEFTVKRTPKFEFVYDIYTNKPVFQFALETKLSRQELEEMFPEPAGFAIPGLENIFRSVIIQSPWDSSIGIRFDLYYLSEATGLSDWESGEWLIRHGGRLRPER
ncbi:hypothetical protein FLT15_08705 [Paenibacillus thiaminolyticus]|uniref:hypothetical protein n=1 Tax=Paenibacillus thiaminolyticus TaxID=49283 RepID=UPI001163E732|nr:hypothetical protein [Paenibacillus thiaminolyticus]NGP58469.1 hypothetical protein [Paenibacillus thiaminolyticus]